MAGVNVDRIMIGKATISASTLTGRPAPAGADRLLLGLTLLLTSP